MKDMTDITGRSASRLFQLLVMEAVFEFICVLFVTFAAGIGEIFEVYRTFRIRRPQDPGMGFFPGLFSRVASMAFITGGSYHTMGRMFPLIVIVQDQILKDVPMTVHGAGDISSLMDFSDLPELKLVTSQSGNGYIFMAVDTRII